MAAPDWITWRDDRSRLARCLDSVLMIAAATLSAAITLAPWIVGIYTLIRWMIEGSSHD